VKQGKTGMIDYFFATYLEETQRERQAVHGLGREDYDQPSA
jgi:hypothetical protein